MSKKKVTITLSEKDFELLEIMHGYRWPIDSKGNYVNKFTRSDYIRNLIEGDFRNWEKEQE